jgi:hypothetical protein
MLLSDARDRRLARVAKPVATSEVKKKFKKIILRGS